VSKKAPTTNNYWHLFSQSQSFYIDFGTSIKRGHLHLIHKCTNSRNNWPICFSLSLTKPRKSHLCHTICPYKCFNCIKLHIYQCIKLHLYQGINLYISFFLFVPKVASTTTPLRCPCSIMIPFCYGVSIPKVEGTFCPMRPPSTFTPISWC
jgi:hypothetical protein